MKYLLIGAGGVASYFLPPFMKTFKPDEIELYDGDILEERNLDRKMLKNDQVGTNKAVALAELYGDLNVKPHYFSRNDILGYEDSLPDVIICMADNHRARSLALEAAEQWGSICLIGGNEYFCSEAYAYHRDWDEAIDPRVRFPEILTDRSGDPMSCQGDEAMEAAPQLATANQTCACFLLNLLYMWTKTAPELAEVGAALVPNKVPVEYVSNFNGIHSKTMNQLINDHKTTRKLQNTR
jgi:hypothetical protein